MDKPKFNLDAHSILLLCNGEQVETDAGKLQLTIVEQAEQSEQAKPVIDLHKDSWAVLNDGSQRFKDTVIKWLNEQNDVSLVGGANSYYGKDYTGVFHYSPSKHRFTHILTIDEFCALAYPKEDVTNEPPVKSLEYSSCYNRLTHDEKIAVIDVLDGLENLQQTNPRQAKQLAATIKLMVIMNDANNGEWIPKAGDHRTTIEYDQELSRITYFTYECTILSLIYFRDYETAQRAYEQNKEIFHDYFGIGGEV